MALVELFLQQIINGIVLGSVYSVCAVGLTLVFGVMSVPNFAHGDIYMLLGAYMAFSLYTLLGEAIVAILCVIPISFLVGLVLNYTLFHDLSRRSLSDTMIMTFGLSMCIQGLTLLIYRADWYKIPSIVTGSLVIGRISYTYERLMIIGVAIAILLALSIFVQKTKLGKAMRATQQNKEAAQAVGVSLSRIYAVTLGMGFALAAIAGALLAPIFYIHPAMGRPIGLKSFTVIILAGLGNIHGAIVCGFIIGVVEAIGGTLLSYAYADAISYIITILVILFIPRGLFGRY
jgi:branched-chain amino acid transport system permease protein